MVDKDNIHVSFLTDCGFIQSLFLSWLTDWAKWTKMASLICWNSKDFSPCCLSFFLITYGRRVFSIKRGLVTRVSVCITFANAPLAKASQLARLRFKRENSKVTVQKGVHVGVRTVCGHFRIWNKGSIHLDLKYFSNKRAKNKKFNIKNTYSIYFLSFVGFCSNLLTQNQGHHLNIKTQRNHNYPAESLLIHMLTKTRRYSTISEWHQPLVLD